jgi:acetyl-CoA acetyltransferase
MMLAAPIPAAKKALKNAGLSASDMDLYEINEAFASIPLAVVKSLGLDLNKLNVNGGAMALGHPLGGNVVIDLLLFFFFFVKIFKRYRNQIGDHFAA